VGPASPLPNGFFVARWCEWDFQVLLVPTPPRCRIVSSEEQSSDSLHYFHFRSAYEPMPNSCPCRAKRNHWSEVVAAQDEVNPKANGRIPKQLASLKAHAILLPRKGRLDLRHLRKRGSGKRKDEALGALSATPN
jgi:hypothetical protein